MSTIHYYPQVIRMLIVMTPPPHHYHHQSRESRVKSTTMMMSVDSFLELPEDGALLFLNRLLHPTTSFLSDNADVMMMEINTQQI